MRWFEVVVVVVVLMVVVVVVVDTEYGTAIQRTAISETCHKDGTRLHTVSQT